MHSWYSRSGPRRRVRLDSSRRPLTLAAPTMATRAAAAVEEMPWSSANGTMKAKATNSATDMSSPDANSSRKGRVRLMRASRCRPGGGAGTGGRSMTRAAPSSTRSAPTPSTT